MEKLIRVPFNVAMSKKIMNGEVEGRIITRDGRSVKIVCWDAKKDDCIVSLVSNSQGVDDILSYTQDGRAFIAAESELDLILEIPENMKSLLGIEKPTKEELRLKFEQLAKPVVDFIKENYHPHATVIIDCEHAELLEGLIGFSVID